MRTENYLHILSEWLLHGSSDSSDHFASFLEKLDGFDLNEYIRAIHFDEWKVPTAPFLLPTSKNYYGLKEMMESELSFLKATVLSKSMEPVTMYSDMPIAEMGKDPEFPKKWMFGMAMMLKKGLHLNQIHNLDRSFDDMMLGLESWIPMYMTGQISPYYLSGTQDNAFSHLLKVSGSVALTGEAINGYHAEGKYYLTKNKEEVAYYKKRASRLLAKASPLMEIFRQEKKSAYHSFLQADAKSGDERHFILSSLPLYTASDDLLSEIFIENQISADSQSEILSYVKMQRKLAEEMLAHSTCTVEIPMLKKEEFLEFPAALSLSGMFFEKDVIYTWETYQKHLDLLQAFAAMHPNYMVVQNPSLAFRNIQIHIHTGKWVIVSKNNTPAIHFLIRHPKMRHAFENMVIPVYLLPK